MARISPKFIQGSNIAGQVLTSNGSDDAPSYQTPSGGTFVGFSAYLSSTYSVTMGTAIKYDTVDFDSNSAYNTSTGEYTVPLTGKYYLSAQAYSSANMGIGVLINGSPMAKGGGYIGSNTATINGSGSAFLNLTAGDTVSIFSDTTTTIQTNYAAFNMFKVG